MSERAFAFAVSLVVLTVLCGCGSTAPAATGALDIPAPRDQAAPEGGSGNRYFGQRPPGSYPEHFAAGIITGDLHSSPAFTPEGDEVYWARQGAKIYRAALSEGGVWTTPEPVAFSPAMTDYRDPFISPSGDRLFFLSKGKLPGSDLPIKENVWFVERNAAGWGEPRPLPEAVNAFDLHWQVSAASNGDLYFGSTSSGGDIYVSKFRDSGYERAEKLSERINGPLMETTPYIAPDGSYLIFARIMSESGNPILYISFAEGSDGWSEAVRIEGIYYGLCPIVSPDGKYLFFLSNPRSVSWIDAGFIQQLRP